MPRGTSSTRATWSRGVDRRLRGDPVDAGKGVLTQTRRHSYLVALLGIRHVVVAVNKMERSATTRRPSGRSSANTWSARRIGLEEVTCIPVSALLGDNVLERGESSMVRRSEPDGLPGGRGGEQAALDGGRFRMPVQWVNRAVVGLPGLRRNRGQRLRQRPATRW